VAINPAFVLSYFLFRVLTVLCFAEDIMLQTFVSKQNVTVSFHFQSKIMQKSATNAYFTTVICNLISSAFVHFVYSRFLRPHTYIIAKYFSAFSLKSS